MSSYRLRLTPERSTETFWRTFDVGGERSLFEFQEAIVAALEFDGDRRWFFGTDRDYWASPVKYQSPGEFESFESGGSMRWDEDVVDARDMTIESLGLDRWGQLCFLFDYVEEWRFYATIERIHESGSDRHPPELVEQCGDPVAVLPRQYAPRREG
ncbi:IS1096 element passenger TnpR family protein [Haloarchaeobius baliensis]|uniref:IS1096 element passenger TnpR family protein n=1 Tax=Haloarchaeobius baliensis TaxID=1670458 RepID=UPI003F884D6C